MSIKLLLLKSGENVIADVKELISEQKVHGYLLIYPQKLLVDRPFLFEENAEVETKSEVKISMSPWIFLSKDSEIAIRPEWVVTLTEPIDSVKLMYEQKINAKDDDKTIIIDEQSSSDN